MTHHWVTFECGHRAALLDEEFGDGSAWCQRCADFQVYQDADDAADAANDALFADGAPPVFIASKIGGGSSASDAATRDSGALRTVPTPEFPNGPQAVGAARYGSPCQRCGSCVWPHVCKVTVIV